MRKYTQDDAAFVFDMYSRWEMQQFLAPGAKPMETMDEAVQAIERWRSVGANNRLLGICAVTTRDDGRRVGTVMFKMAPLAWETEPLPLSDDYEIAWHLHPSYSEGGSAGHCLTSLSSAGQNLSREPARRPSHNRRMRVLQPKAAGQEAIASNKVIPALVYAAKTSSGVPAGSATATYLFGRVNAT
jgi:hypothetical protein